MEKKYYVVRTGQKSDELYHWKYIKKVKKNGKWRYYYDKDQLAKDAEKLVDKIDNINGTKLANIREAWKDYEEYQDYYDKNEREYSKGEGNWTRENYYLTQGYHKVKAAEAQLAVRQLQSDYVETLAGKGKMFIRNLRKKFDKDYNENYDDWLDRVTGVEKLENDYDARREARKRRNKIVDSMK